MSNNIIHESINSWLTESKVITPNSNAPCAAFEAVYQKKCPHGRGKGMLGDHPKKEWKGMLVDANLDEKWLNDLNNIKDIEIRSSCEGHDKNWVAFVIFRFLNKNIDKNEDKINSIISNLESDNITKVSANVGSMGRTRIVVAAPIFKGHKNWEVWWSTLADRIKKAINN